MPETLNLNYYYGNEADQYSFYRIPKNPFDRPPLQGRIAGSKGAVWPAA